MMKRSKLKLALAASVCVVGTFGTARGAVPNWEWVNPCVAPLDCGPFCPPVCGCVCQAAWDDPNVWLWTGGPCPGGCEPSTMGPALPGHRALIEKSNTGSCANGGAICSEHCDCGGCKTCNGGYCPRTGAPCDTDADCNVGKTCDNIELYLELELTTESIGELTIETESTIATTDGLKIDFQSKDAANTLTVSNLTIDATVGDVMLTISDSATIQTTSNR